MMMSRGETKFNGGGRVNTAISLFGGFLKKKILLESSIAIFENSSLKGSPWPNMKNFDILVLATSQFSIFRVTPFSKKDLL